MSNDYKEVLLQPPTDLQIILALNSLLIAYGISDEGFPPYLKAYSDCMPSLIWSGIFLCSGFLSVTNILGYSSARLNVFNHVLLMFLWSWIAIGSLTSNLHSMIAYVLISPVLSCLWIIAHSMLPKIKR